VSFIECINLVRHVTILKGGVFHFKRDLLLDDMLKIMDITSVMEVNMHIKTTVITFSGVNQRGALLQHISGWKDFPVVVACENTDRGLYRELNYKTVCLGKNFLETLRHLISVIDTETFTFIYPGCFVNPNYFREAASILRAPNVGLVAPSLNISFGTQSPDQQVQFRQASKVMPWCFSGRVNQVKSILNDECPVIDLSIVPYLCTTLVLNGLFQVVLLKYILQTPNLSEQIDSWNDFLLDRPVKALEPILIYTGQGEVPLHASKLFTKVVRPPIAQLPRRSFAFVLNEDEDFAPSVTKEKIQRLCVPPEPTVLLYDLCVVDVWNGYRVGNLSWSPRAFRTDIPKLSSLMLAQPDPTVSLPADIRRVSGVVIHRKLKELPKASTNVQPLTSPSLTIATIMKNEKKRLLPYLSLTLPFADEVLLVDTGSSDGSDKYAEKFGARVVNFKFRDHFAEARNVYLKKCETEWLLHLDIDEALDLKRLMNLILSDLPSLDGIQLQVLNVLKQSRSYVHQDAIRVIKNPNSWYYTGRVHETVEECAAKESKTLIRSSGLTIYHFGYLSSTVPNKLRYYRKLNELQMRENPQDCRPYFNLALHELNQEEIDDDQLDKVTKMLKTSIELCDTFVLAKYELSRVYCLKALRLIESIMQLAPQDHPLYKEVSEVHTLLKNYTRRIIVEE